MYDVGNDIYVAVDGYLVSRNLIFEYFQRLFSTNPESYVWLLKVFVSSYFMRKLEKSMVSELSNLQNWIKMSVRFQIESQKKPWSVTFGP